MAAVTLDHYRCAQDCFDRVLASVPSNRWDEPSACELWTVRDVAGHVFWAQEQLRHWSTGQTYTQMAGAPGASHPAEMTGDDPVATWRAARAAADEALTGEALSRTALLPYGEVPLSALFPLLVTDLLAHAWDIATPLDMEVRFDPALIAGSFAWARDHVVRAPGFFGPEVTPPDEADEQTRWLAFLGRPARQPENGVQVRAGWAWKRSA